MSNENKYASQNAFAGEGMTTMTDPGLYNFLEGAAWDVNETLRGSDIWGTRSPFAQRRANHLFTRESAKRELDRYRDQGAWDQTMGDLGPWYAVDPHAQHRADAYDAGQAI